VPAFFIASFDAIGHGRRTFFGVDVTRFRLLDKALTMALPQDASLRHTIARSMLRAVTAALLLTSASLALAQDAPTEFRVIQLSAGIHVIRAEVAVEPSERERGLMFRKQLGANQGMVFLFDQPAVQCMWMRNTLIPLSVAFIDNDGRVINVEEMAAQTDDNHCAAKPARYALEMNKGWFAKHGIPVGTKISGLPKPPSS
jgi:uncharacterized membrane protein (UPF0127 family)